MNAVDALHDDAAEHFLELLWQPGDVREVRIPEAGYGSRAGYFDDPARAAAAVAEWDGRANVYVTLNPVRPDLLARAVNRLDKLKSTTADVDITGRRWLLVDVDPKRPAGVSATDAESAAALDVARAVWRYLDAEGWPQPIVSLTGNGYALLYPTDLPNEAGTTAIVAGWLRALAARFDTEAVSIDTTVSNAARIGCLVGTLKKKGDSTAERPHRRSAIVREPSELVAVPRERLEALAGPTNGQYPSRGDGTFSGWVRERLDAAGIVYREQPVDAAGIVWYGLESCPFCGQDSRWQCGVGEAPDGRGAGKCFHNRGAGKGWADFRDALGLGGVTLNLSGSDILSATPDVPPGTKQPAPFAEFEDRGAAELSELGHVEYVEDLIRPGRLVTWAAEEGTGKSYAVDGELGIRLAVAGGDFAGTWPVLTTGPVVYLSEMHPDDDFTYESTVLDSLGLDRARLAGRYYRLPLATAAGGPPPLASEAWRSWFVEECRRRGVLLAIFDTATAATQVDPWGREMQGVYAGLRAMLEAYPALAVVLVIHLKKPQGRGERRISDLLGEWGRWCDVVVLQEADGRERTKLSTMKRVRHHRRISATKEGGLLVNPVDLDDAAGAKVPTEAVVAAIVAAPGMTYVELAAALDVSKDTAARYVRLLGERVVTRLDGQRHRVYEAETTAAPPQTAAQARYGGTAVVPDAARGTDRRTPHALDSAAVGAAAVDGADNGIDLTAAAERIFGDDLAKPETPWDTSAMVAKPRPDA